MTPEQQKMFKKAVAENSIPAMKYEDYCKITPEQAEKMLKGFADKAGPAPGSRTEHHAPEIKDPDSPATKFQKRALAEAVKNGHLERLPDDQWKNLTKGEASKIIAEVHAKQPPEPATEAQMQEIEKLVKDGRIYPMKTETFNSLSKEKASRLIGTGRMNLEKDVRVEGYDPNYVSRRNQPCTKEQKDELKRLVAEKRLNPVFREKWNSLTQGEAGKLIYVGKQREAANEFAPERERSSERVPAPVPERGGTAAKKPERSDNDDIPF